MLCSEVVWPGLETLEAVLREHSQQRCLVLLSPLVDELERQRSRCSS